MLENFSTQLLLQTVADRMQQEQEVPGAALNQHRQIALTRIRSALHFLSLAEQAVAKEQTPSL